MPESLYWNTVTPLLRTVLLELMGCKLLDPFRLVGGTSLSLQLGHRISIDIDLFTDADYGTIDFDAIDDYLRGTYSYFNYLSPGQAGMGRSYFIGDNADKSVKLDLFYTTDAFFQPQRIIDNIRLATIDEIIAMKVDIVQRGGRKKDFWDLHEAMNLYTPEQMISLHAERYPYNHDKALIRSNFIDFTNADDDLEPNCLRGKYWELIKLEIIEALE